MQPPEVSKFLNVGTFFQNALNSNFLFPNMSSTVISAWVNSDSDEILLDSGKISPDSGKIWKNGRNPTNSLESGEIRWTHFSDAMFPVRFTLLRRV